MRSKLVSSPQTQRKPKEKARNPPKQREKAKEKPPKTGQSSQNKAKENPENADRIVLKLWTLASLIFLIRPVLRGQLKRGGIKPAIRTMAPKSFSPNDKRGNPNQGNRDTQNPQKRAPKKRPQEGNPSKPPGARWIHRIGRTHFQYEACSSRPNGETSVIIGSSHGRKILSGSWLSGRRCAVY